MILRVHFHTDMTEVYEGNLGLFMDMLRLRMEIGAWKAAWREAMERNDHEALDQLDREYNMIGLP